VSRVSGARAASLFALSFLVAPLLLASGGCGSCGGAEPAALVDAGNGPSPWVVRSEETLTIALAEAHEEAARRRLRVMLVFVGFGDPDSEAVVRALGSSAARAALSARYVPLYVNVGRDCDGHVRLRHAHDVRRLATLVVLEPRGRRVARQTFAPVSDGRPLAPDALAAWLAAPRGR
jgi:hypothetical protein